MSSEKGLAYMQQQELSLLHFFYQVKEVVLLIVGARMDSDWFTKDPSPTWKSIGPRVDQ